MQKTLGASANRRFIAIFCIALTLPLSAPTNSQVRLGGLPNLGDGESISVPAERRLGQRIAREIYRDPDYMDDPVLVDYVQSIWQPLMAAARARGELTPELAERFAWEPMLIRDRTVNAFALPGGYMGVHLGLIALVTSRDELASVLGHELTHITQRHIARMTAQQAQQGPWVLAAMILGVLAARKSADAANAAIAGSQAVGAQAQLNFSRDMEREADRIGFNVMTDAGFDGRGFSGMFDKLQTANRINDNGSFPYLRSHPLTTERIASAQLRVTQITSSPQASAPAPHAEALLMAARAKVLVDPGVDALRAWALEASAPANATTLAALPSARRAAVLYTAILSKVRLKDMAGIDTLLAQATAVTAHDPAASAAVNLLAAEVAIAAGQPARALLLLPPVATSRAQRVLSAQAHSALATQADLEQAASNLQTWVADHPMDALAWQTLATLYRQQGLATRSIRAEAEARIALMDYSAAQDRLKAAQALGRKPEQGAAADNIEASIIDTRSRQVALLLREQALER